MVPSTPAVSAHDIVTSTHMGTWSGGGGDRKGNIRGTTSTGLDLTYMAQEMGQGSSHLICALTPSGRRLSSSAWGEIASMAKCIVHVCGCMIHNMYSNYSSCYRKGGGGGQDLSQLICTHACILISLHGESYINSQHRLV